MATKNKNDKNITMPLILLAGFAILDTASLFLPFLLSPIHNIHEALIFNLFQIGAGVAIIILTIVIISRDSNWWSAILIIPILLYIGSLFAPLSSPYSKYPLFVIKCNGRPVTVDGFTGTYALPGDRTYGVNPFTSHFFCTEKAAQAAHFQRDSDPLSPQ